MLLPFQERNTPTFGTEKVHSQKPSISFHDAPSSPLHPSPLPQFQWLFTLLRQLCIVAQLAQKDVRASPLSSTTIGAICQYLMAF